MQVFLDLCFGFTCVKLNKDPLYAYNTILEEVISSFFEKVFWFKAWSFEIYFESAGSSPIVFM